MTSFPKLVHCIFHFMGKYSKFDRVKTMGNHWKINAILWNIKINLQNVVGVCKYELPINLQNFTQKDMTKVKIFQKVIGGLLFLIHPVYVLPSLCFSFLFYSLEHFLKRLLNHHRQTAAQHVCLVCLEKYV